MGKGGAGLEEASLEALSQMVHELCLVNATDDLTKQ